MVLKIGAIMKERMGWVSNSSSSSFIFFGDNCTLINKLDIEYNIDDKFILSIITKTKKDFEKNIKILTKEELFEQIVKNVFNYINSAKIDGIGFSNKIKSYNHKEDPDDWGINE